MSARTVIRWLMPEGGKNRPPMTILGDPTPVTMRGEGPASVLVTRQLWAELHRRALIVNTGDDTSWLAAFTDRLPCGQCRLDWLRMLKATPPNFSDYFAWTVARHNEINRLLKKPEVTVQEAYNIWTKK